MPTMVKGSRSVPRDSDGRTVAVSDFRRLVFAVTGGDRLTSGDARAGRLWGRFCLDFGGVSTVRALLRFEFAPLAGLLTVFLARLRAVVRLESVSFMRCLSQETLAHRFARSHLYSVERSMFRIPAARALSPSVRASTQSR